MFGHAQFPRISGNLESSGQYDVPSIIVSFVHCTILLKMTMSLQGFNEVVTYAFHGVGKKCIYVTLKTEKEPGNKATWWQVTHACLIASDVIINQACMSDLLLKHFYVCAQYKVPVISPAVFSDN